MNFEESIKAMGLAPLQATCVHDRITVDSEEATTHTGFSEERIIQVRVYRCEDCKYEWVKNE